MGLHGDGHILAWPGANHGAKAVCLSNVAVQMWLLAFNSDGPLVTRTIVEPLA